MLLTVPIAEWLEGHAGKKGVAGSIHGLLNSNQNSWQMVTQIWKKDFYSGVYIILDLTIEIPF